MTRSTTPPPTSGMRGTFRLGIDATSSCGAGAPPTGEAADVSIEVELPAGLVAEVGGVERSTSSTGTPQVGQNLCPSSTSWPFLQTNVSTPLTDTTVSIAREFGPFVPPSQRQNRGCTI